MRSIKVAIREHYHHAIFNVLALKDPWLINFSSPAKPRIQDSCSVSSPSLYFIFQPSEMTKNKRVLQLWRSSWKVSISWEDSLRTRVHWPHYPISILQNLSFFIKKRTNATIVGRMWEILKFDCFHHNNGMKINRWLFYLRSAEQSIYTEENTGINNQG